MAPDHFLQPVIDYGYLLVVDRAADVIKSGGEWISSVELENALMDRESVSSAAVVGVPDDRWQERPCAYVVSSGPVSTDELRAFLAERFLRFWVPDRVVFVGRIPLTSVGKFDKRALRATPGQQKDSGTAVTLSGAEPRVPTCPGARRTHSGIT
jgi:fatty-acyl-CoA synthase